jgi:hypothetical protein
LKFSRLDGALATARPRAYYRPMYAIDLIRRVPGTEEPEIVAYSVPDAETAEAAIEAGHRVYKNRGVELTKNDCRVDGFRVTRRGGDVVCTWYADA